MRLELSDVGAVVEIVVYSVLASEWRSAAEAD